MARTILHVDLDAFFASVEQRDDPSLRGRPVIVGGHSRRGVVCAASYEVRPFGVRSAMSMVEALSRCPDAVVLTPRMSHYAEVSREFFDVLGHWSPLVEGLSLDEAFLDVSGEERLFGDGVAIARGIKAEVRERLQLVASVGVASCKFAAKIASDLGKPDGLLTVPEDVAGFLAPLPVGRLWGVGRVTEGALARLGLRTIGDVARTDESVLRPTVGAEVARHLSALARGHDTRPVVSDRAPVSVGAEETFDRDLHSTTALLPQLLTQADRACARLRRQGLRARVVTVKVKYADHRSVTRRRTLPAPLTDQREIGRIAVLLLDEVPEIERRGVRLIGVSLGGLVDGNEPAGKSAPTQLSLGVDLPAAAAESAPLDVARSETLGRVLDTIADRFGGGAIRRAITMPESTAEDDSQ